MHSSILALMSRVASLEAAQHERVDFELAENARLALERSERDVAVRREAERDEARREVEALRRFAGAILADHRSDLSDVDGGTIQDAAVASGLMVAVPVAEPCADNCRCRDYGEFPHDCIRYTDMGRAAIDAARGEG